MIPLHNSNEKSYSTGWQSTGWLAAREKLDVKIINDVVHIQFAARSAFAHAVATFLHFFGKQTDDLWQSVNTTARNLTPAEKEILIANLPPPETALKVQQVVDTIQNILPELQLLQNPSLPDDVIQKAQEQTAALKQAVSNLETTIAKSLSTEIDSTEPERSPLDTKAITPHSHASDLSEPVDNIQRLSTRSLSTKQTGQKEPTPFPSHLEVLPSEDVQSPEELKNTIRKTKQNALSIIQSLDKDASAINNTLSTPSALLGEIKKIRQSTKAVLKQTRQNHPSSEATLEKQLTEARALYKQTEEWLTDVQKIHASIIKINALETRLDEVLSKLEEYDISLFESIDFKDWQARFNDQRSRLTQAATLEEAIEKETLLNDSLRELSTEFADAAKENLQTLRNNALSGLSNSSILETRSDSWSQLEKHLPNSDTNWYAVDTWYSELKKAALIDSALEELLNKQPDATFAQLIASVVHQIGSVGRSIIKQVEEQVDEEMFQDDPMFHEPGNLEKLIIEMQKAFKTMEGNQQLTANNLRQWSDYLVAITDKTLSTYNFSTASNQKLIQEKTFLQTLKYSFDFLITKHNLQHEAFFEEQEDEYKAILVESECHPSVKVCFDAFMQGLRDVVTWNDSERSLSELASTKKEWNQASLEAEDLLDCLKDLKASHQRFEQQKEIAYAEAAKASAKSQKKEQDDLDVFFGKFDSSIAPSLPAKITSTLQIKNYRRSVEEASSTAHQHTKEITKRNNIAQKMDNFIDERINKVHTYRSQITEMEEWLGIDLMYVAQEKLDDTEDLLKELKEKGIDNMSLPYRWWDTLVYFGSAIKRTLGSIVRAPLNMLMYDRSVRQINRLMDQQDRTKLFVDYLEQDIQEVFPVNYFFKTFSNIKNHHSSIQNRIQELYNEGQIEHAEFAEERLEKFMRNLRLTLKRCLPLNIFDPLIGLPGHGEIPPSISFDDLGGTAGAVPLLYDLKQIMPKLLNNVAEVHRKISTLSFYSLLSQVEKADTPQKATYLKNALLRNIHTKLADTQKKWSEDVEKMEDISENFKTELKDILSTNHHQLEKLKKEVVIKRNDLDGFGGTKERIPLEDLEINELAAYHAEAEKAIGKGSSALSHARKTIQKVETAEESYNSVMKEALERLQWLDKTNQLIAHQQLQTIVERTQEKFEKEQARLLNKNVLTANAAVKGANTVSMFTPAKLTDYFSSISSVGRYRKFLGGLTKEMTAATKKSYLLDYPTYIDQLNDKKITDEIASKVCKRYINFVHNEINQGITSIKKYKEIAEGPLELYLDKHCLWNKAKTNTAGSWVAAKLFPEQLAHLTHNVLPEDLAPRVLPAAYKQAPGVEELSLSSLIESKVQQLENLKEQFPKSARFGRKHHILVTDNLSSQDLKDYNEAVKQAKKSLADSMEKETHLTAAAKNLTVFKTLLSRAKEEVSTFEERKQFLLKKKLEELIETSEDKLTSLEGKLSSESDVHAFSQNLLSYISAFQNILAEGRDPTARHTILDQLAKVDRDSDQGKKFAQIFVDEVNTIISDYKKQIGSLESMADKLLENAIITLDLEHTFKEILKSEKFGPEGISPFADNKIRSFTTPTSFGFTRTDKAFLKELPLSELRLYDDKLRKHAVPLINKVTPNPDYKLTKIDKQIRLESLHIALYGDRYVGFHKTLEKLTRLVEEVGKAYDDPAQELKLKAKYNHLVAVAHFLIDKSTKSISSEEDMRIAFTVVNSQVAHLNNFITNLKKQKRHYKRAEANFKKQPDPIAVSIPPLAKMHQINNLQQNKYLLARWKFLTGETLVGNVPANHAAALGGPPQPLAPASTVMPFAAYPSKGTPHFNARQMSLNLTNYGANITNALNTPLSTWQRTGLNKLNQFIAENSNLFLHYHQGYPAYNPLTGVYSIRIALNTLGTVEDINEYLLSIQSHYEGTLKHLREEINKYFTADEIKTRNLGLPDMYTDIEWKY